MRADVVVAGYGPAGAAAAIAAHDAGRSVLILESAERGGGNARYSGGFLFHVPGDAAVAHLDALLRPHGPPGARGLRGRPARTGRLAVLTGRAGRDEAFGRSADTLVPLDLGRLYAIETWPGIAGTTGGPRHDERARVLRPDGRPVPGLYAAGAVSLVWGHLIEHGGGLTDAMVFGRIAGTEAAARSTDG